MDSKHLMTGPEGNSEFCFPRISIEIYSKANGSNRWKTNNHVIDK